MPTLKASPETIKQVQSRIKEIKQDRETWHAHWQDIKDYVLPFHGRGLSGKSSTEDNNGTKKHGKIIDSTATDAANVIAAGLQSGLTSPARPWFSLGFADKKLMDRGNVRLWLDGVENMMRYVFSTSNFYMALHHVYLELVTFATGAFSIEENFDTVIHCRTYTVGEYYLSTNEIDRVDTLVGVYHWTAKQLVSEFGKDKLPEKVITAFDNGNTELKFGVTQLVEPNDKRMELKDVLDRPYRSIWYLDGDPGELLRVSGFSEFPFITPRWKVVGKDIYGSMSPGMNQLGNTKMLQKMQEKSIKAMDKMVDPPVVASPSMKNDVINTLPGGVSFSDMANGQAGVRQLYEMRFDISSVEAKIQNVQTQIKRGYYNDLFLMLSAMPAKTMTATEVAERHEEKLLMIGPVLERLHDELLDRAIDRTFAIMLRAGLVPQPPREIQGQALKVDYISILAQAQKMVKLAGVREFIGFTGQLSSIAPEVMDNVDMDRAVRDYGDGVGVPADIMRSEEGVAQIREVRAKQQAQQVALQQAQQVAEGAKTLSQSDLSKQNALNALLGRTPAPAQG